MLDIQVNLAATRKPLPDPDTLQFGKVFTDHMFLMNYDAGQGWHDPRVVPYGPLSMEPSCMVFHYAQEIFEGMKAYRTPEGKVQLFRPVENARRLNSSCQRLCIPEIPEEDFVQAVKALVKVDEAWVPNKLGTSLYIRPFIIATDCSLGVHASHSYLFAIICCPVGAYYPEGINPVKIYVENEDVRAVRGGTGYTKCGGNYAASIRAGERAEENGYAQVLWLDGVHRKYIEEVGSMNVMFQIGDTVVTPELTGSVLPGQAQGGLGGPAQEMDPAQRAAPDADITAAPGDQPVGGKAADVRLDAGRISAGAQYNIDASGLALLQSLRGLGRHAPHLVPECAVDVQIDDAGHRHPFFLVVWFWVALW